MKTEIPTFETDEPAATVRYAAQNHVDQGRIAVARGQYPAERGAAYRRDRENPNRKPGWHDVCGVNGEVKYHHGQAGVRGRDVWLVEVNMELADRARTQGGTQTYVEDFDDAVKLLAHHVAQAEEGMDEGEIPAFTVEPVVALDGEILTGKELFEARQEIAKTWGDEVGDALKKLEVGHSILVGEGAAAGRVFRRIA